MTPHRRPITPLLLLLTSLLLSATTITLSCRKRPQAEASSKPTTTSQPATRLAAATKPTPPYIPKLLFDVVKHDHPQYASTQPFTIPLDLRDAAHYTLAGPIYFDRARLDLWITRPTAPPTATALRTANDDQTHVVRDRVLYVHWQPDDSGSWFPHPIIATPTGPELIYPSGHHLPLPNRNYDFSRPLSYNNFLALPTPTGVVILRIENNKLTEYNHTLPGLSTRHSAPSTESNVQLLLDSRGLLAFLPSTSQFQGSRGVSRFLDGTWTDLTPDKGFPAKVLHLMPLLDGSLLAIVPTTPGHVDLQLLTLDAAPAVDLPAVTKLVQSLSDDNEQTRQQAYDQLTRYGPSIFPTLEKLLPDQRPEAKIRLIQLLRSKLKPTLGPATILDDKLQLVSRAPDGSAVFYADAGISLPTPNDTPEIISPAWLSLRPGQPVRLLPASLTQDLKPNTAHLIPFQTEWILPNTPNGPSRFIGNQLVPLLKPDERHFSHFIGIDRRGRWLFQSPTPSNTTTHPTTTPLSSFTIQNSEFLLLDPTLPDPTPRLPSWTIDIKDATVGWDQHDNPALKAGSAFILTATDWKPLDPKTDTFSTTPSTIPLTPEPNPFSPRSLRAIPTSTTAPTSIPSTQHSELGTPLLTTADGTRYYDARTHLISLTKDNLKIEWPLPPEHTATIDPVLIFADNHLFLFNQPGKCVRLTPTPDQPEPFQVDATFTKNIPNTDHPLRIWLDPAGRICFAPDDRHLTLFFPTGRIPPEIVEKMPPDQIEANSD